MSDRAKQPIKRFDGVRSRVFLKMAMVIRRFKMTAKGAEMIFMMAVTRFSRKRSETRSKDGSGR